MGITRSTTIGLVAVAALVAAALGSQMAFAQGDGNGGTSDDALLERLDDLEISLPAIAPSDVQLDPEETWGTLEGDFGGAAATIDTLDDDLRSLFRDSDDAEGVVAEAVSNVTRGWLDLGEAYDALAEWEANDLAFPLDTEDDEGVATGADEARGDAERGLRHVLAAQERHLAGYVALREEGAAPEADAQARLDSRAAEAEEFDEQIRPLIHELLSLSTTMVLMPAERFETDAPGVEARARSFTITCIDREAYMEMQQGASAGDVPSAEEIAEELGLTQERIDCPDLPEGAGGGPMAPVDGAADDDADELDAVADADEDDDDVAVGDEDEDDEDDEDE